MLSKWQRRATIHEGMSLDYLGALKDVCLGAVMLLLFFFLVLFALLYSANLIWVFYTATPIGQRFLMLYAEYAKLITSFLSRDLLVLTVDITWVAFGTCFITCCGIRFFHLASRIYNPHRGMVNVVLFGVPMTVLAGWQHYQSGVAETVVQGSAMAVIPVLIFFPKCFDYTSRLIPEMGDLFDRVKAFYEGLKS
ncbi:MAG: hypothetical protein MI802_10475 [Desulfobacterales bacterium]|nr:hypothetical protein [Desulfobacterales bacterium]